MRTRIAAGLMIGMIAAGCGGRKDKEGLGAGADTAGMRDTTTATPTPAPISDSVRERTSRILGDSTSQPNAAGTPKNQTQSGMKNKAGQSTLGTGVRSTRPDASKPVMAKGDTLARSADQRATDSLNRAVLDRLSQRDSASITGNDTMPQPAPVPPIPTPSDTTKPDSTKPVPTDSLKPVPTDSTRTPPPLPLDTIRPMRDSTKRDSTHHR